MYVGGELEVLAKLKKKKNKNKNKNKESTRKEGKNLIEMNVTFLFIRVAVYACFKSSCCFKGNPRINENHGEILMQDLDFFFYFLLLSPS